MCSGKQSLCRLAACIQRQGVFTLPVTADYSIADLKEHLKGLYQKAGVRPALPIVFMMTESVILDEPPVGSCSGALISSRRDFLRW